MPPALPKLYVLRLFQLSLGVSLDGLTPAQLGLAVPEPLHDIFEGHARQQGPPSYRVRLCRRCSGTSERLDKGTYDTLEEACLVHDTWQLKFGSTQKCHVLVPGDEQWIDSIPVRKLARRVQSVVTIGKVLAEETAANAVPVVEVTPAQREYNLKRYASEVVPYSMRTIEQNRDGLASLVRQFIFFEHSIANILVRDNIPITSSLQAFAAAIQTQHRRKVARYMQQAIAGSGVDGTRRSNSLLPRNAMILLQAKMLRMILTASLHVPLSDIPEVVRRVEELSPVIPANDLLEVVDRELEVTQGGPMSQLCIERGQVLAASSMRFVMEFELDCLLPIESESDSGSERVWTVVDRLSTMMDNAHLPFRRLTALLVRARSNQSDEDVTDLLKLTVEPMLTSAMRLLMLGRGPIAIMLVYFSPTPTTLFHVSNLSDDHVMDAQLFPNTVPVMQAMVRESWLHALVAKVMLQNQPIIDAKTMAQMDAVALFVVAYRYNHFGRLTRNREWRSEGPPEMEMYALASILSYICFRSSVSSDRPVDGFFESVTRENVTDIVSECLQHREFEGQWCHQTLHALYPEFTLEHVLAELDRLLAEYSAFARELQIGFLTNFGVPAIALLLRLVKHHCPGADPQVVANICASCVRILDVNSQRFGIARLLPPLLEQPLYVVRTDSDDELTLHASALLPRPRSVAETMREAVEDPGFDEFFNLT